MAAAGYELRGIYGTEPYWPEKKLKICVTGAGGFIGSHLAKRLKEEGHHVVACDWKRNEHMEVRGRFRLDSTRGRRRRRRRDGWVIALLRVNCFGRFDSVETRRWTSRTGERRRVIPSGNG